MNPYLIETPFSVSFSGGRTSGYMLRKILDAYGGELPKDGHVLFGNTGNEMEETLAFIHEVETKWCPVEDMQKIVDANERLVKELKDAKD